MMKLVLEKYESLLKYTKFDAIPVSTLIFISFKDIKFGFILLFMKLPLLNEYSIPSELIYVLLFKKWKSK